MMQKNKGVFAWLSVALVVFVAAYAVIVLHFDDRLAGLATIGYFQLVELGLASYRMANILSTEMITKPLRAPFVTEVHKEGKVVEKPKRKGLVGATGLLIHCPSCTGVWLAAALVYLYLFLPTPTFLLALILALSGIERIVSNVMLWYKK